ncbi:MAG: hypothetical protein B7X54_06410 [Idiomarina sp. 34-48-12]|nr:MAG: hypothetical protein B7X54_06410 [Idiomarina sp. 34-48-12]
MKVKVFIFALLSVFLLSSCEQQPLLEQHRTNKKIFHKFDPDQLRVEEPILITFIAPKGIVLQQGKLEGVSMYMGVIPLVVEQHTDTSWQVKVWLGACSDPQMRWRGVVPWINATTNKRGYYQFEFTTETN